MRRDEVNRCVCDADGDDCSLDAEDDGADEFFAVHGAVVSSLTLVVVLLLCEVVCQVIKSPCLLIEYPMVDHISVGIVHHKVPISSVLLESRCEG